MKTKLKSILLIGVLALAVAGCQTNKQTAAYKSIAAVQTGATATLNGYYALVIKGTVPTNGVPSVSAAYNHLQGSVMVAVIEASGDTNAAAPVALIGESALFGLTVANASTIKK